MLLLGRKIRGPSLLKRKPTVTAELTVALDLAPSPDVGERHSVPDLADKGHAAGLRSAVALSFSGSKFSPAGASNNEIGKPLP